MSATIAIFSFILMFLFELLYIKFAKEYGIKDEANHRSSHHSPTIRGGGIIFGVSAILFFFVTDVSFPYFLIGLFVISLVSFLDDLLTLSNKVRIAAHFLCVMLLFSQWEILTLPIYSLIAVGIAIIGTINAYNFMDGINGITGAYSIIAVCTLIYVNTYQVQFTSSAFLSVVLLSILTFCCFNFRTKALCFAGDVGSVSMSFIIIFLLGQLVVKSGNLGYINLLLVYGLDTATTIFFRLIRRENIFVAHRSHFYQFLANEKGISHLFVAVGYAFLQLLINCIVVFQTKTSIAKSGLLIFVCLIIFVVLRLTMEGKKLLGTSAS